MAKKVFVSAMVLAASCFTAWGQVGNYGTGNNTVNISADNSTLTITVNGDATKIDNISQKIETAIAGGNYSTIIVNGGQINSAIVQSIKNSKLTTIDLGTTTVKDFSQSTFTWNHANLQTITLPLTTVDAEGKMTVPEYALNAPLFNSNSQITKVIIPEGYTNIGDNAFYNNNYTHNLNVTFTVTLPSTLKEIGTSAFQGALQMTDVILPEGLMTIGKQAFKGCKNLTDPKFPSTLKEILSEAYSGIDNIKNIKFNEGIEFIGNSAFFCDHEVKECQKTITFPSSLKYTGPGAFFNRWFSDLYYESSIAPISPIGKLASDPNKYYSAFEDRVHMGNDGFDPTSSEGNPNADIAQNGYANRENYKNGGSYFAMLHFPKIEDIGEINAATYTDITREYTTTKVNPDETFYPAAQLKVGKEKITYVFDNGHEWSNGCAPGIVNPGYIDTYRGKQYIWPSQSQWMRSFVCNSLGYNWDGVTEYRPTLTDEHIKLMIKDGLTIKNAEGKDVVISEDANTFTYDEITAAEHNATLSGAVTTNTVKVEAVFCTQKEADDHNAELDGAIKAGDEILYTNDEVNQHNAKLPGAVKAGDIQTEGHDDIYYGEDEYKEYMVAVKAAVDAKKIENWHMDMTENDFIKNLNIKKNTNDWCWEPVSFIKSPKTETIYYTEETANEHNLNLNGAWQYDKVKGIATAETAKEYNRTLHGAWTTETIKIPAVFYTAEEANTHNATLQGAVTADMTTSSANAYADELSKIAYMGTRQCVFADGNIKASNEYPIDVKGGQWWTICVPFNMTKKQIDDVFGVNTHVCLFSDVERDAEGLQKKITLKFVHDVYAHKTVKDANGKYAANFDENAAACEDDNDIVIYAHESYMIHPTKTDDDAVFVVKNYEPIAGSPLPTIVKASDGTEYRFIGNYTTKIGGDETRKAIARIKTVTIPQYSYMYAQKKGDTVAKFWFYSGTTMAWKANKCVVQATAKDGGTTDFNNFFGDTTNQAKQASIFGSDDIDDKPTEIEHVEIIAGEQPTNNIKYDLYGRRVADNYKGIYIMNGKKYINR